MARQAIIRKVAGYELHSVRYYQLFLTYTDAPDRVQEVRLPHDVLYREPCEGDLVEVDSLLSMVTGLRKLETAAD